MRGQGGCLIDSKRDEESNQKSNNPFSSISTVVVATIILNLESQIQITVFELGSYANR